MDPGMLLEAALRKLAKTGDEMKVYGQATGLQNAIGDKACKDLAKFINDLLKEPVDGGEEE